MLLRKRVTLLLGAVGIAVAVLAIALQTGAWAGGHPYAAASFNPTSSQGTVGSGFSKSAAKQDAKQQCVQYHQNAPNSTVRNGCTGAVWVYNGWVAVAYEKTQEGNLPLNTQWGSGWGYDKQTAKKYALKSCRQAANESCRLDDIVLNKGYPEGTAYRSPTFDSSVNAKGGGW